MIVKNWQIVHASKVIPLNFLQPSNDVEVGGSHEYEGSMQSTKLILKIIKEGMGREGLILTHKPKINIKIFTVRSYANMAPVTQ